MTGVGEPMCRVFDEVGRRTRRRLKGLTDEEYLWEPAPGGWTLRPDTGGRWRIDGDGGGGPAPDPVPVATIAWRIGHIGLMLTDFGTRLFRGRNIVLDDVEFAGTADGARMFLRTAYRTHWRAPLAEMPAERWWQPCGPAFFGYADQPVIDVVLHVLDEFTHHAAEIGVLRDLYPHRGTRS